MNLLLVSRVPAVISIIGCTSSVSSRVLLLSFTFFYLVLLFLQICRCVPWLLIKIIIILDLKWILIENVFIPILDLIWNLRRGNHWDCLGLRLPFIKISWWLLSNIKKIWLAYLNLIYVLILIFLVSKIIADSLSLFICNIHLCKIFPKFLIVRIQANWFAFS